MKTHFMSSAGSVIDSEMWKGQQKWRLQLENISPLNSKDIPAWKFDDWPGTQNGIHRLFCVTPKQNTYSHLHAHILMCCYLK